MTNRICMLLSFVALVSIAMTAQTKLELISVDMPKYPPLAHRARVQGDMNFDFRTRGEFWRTLECRGGIRSSTLEVRSDRKC